MSNEPSWLTEQINPSATAPPAPASDFTSGPSYAESRNGGGNSGASSSSSSGGSKYKCAAKVAFTFMNMGLCVFMAATGALGVKYSTGISDSGNAFVGVYMCLFASILFTHELIQLYPCEVMDNFGKRNFGFLYGINGKSIYTCFMAILCFGLRKPYDLALPCGIVVFAWGIVQVLYHWRFPDHFDKLDKFSYE